MKPTKSLHDKSYLMVYKLNVLRKLRGFLVLNWSQDAQNDNN